MPDRFRIDWSNLSPLPRKKADGATREDLADRKFHAQRAKHKGRCHLSNQKRRQIAQEKAQQRAKESEISLGRYRSYAARVAAYWKGEIDEHP